MTEILAVFRSRSQAIDCMQRARVKTVITGANYSAFYGYMTVPLR